MSASQGLQGISQFRTWRAPQAALDSTPAALTALKLHPIDILQEADGTAFATATFAAHKKPYALKSDRNGRWINCAGFSAIMVKFLFTDTNNAPTANTNAEFRIAAFHEINSPNGPGPGQFLLYGKIKAHDGVDAAPVWDVADFPCFDGKWPAARYIEACNDVGGYDFTTSGYYNNCNAIIIGDANAATANHSSCLLVPTLGYTNLCMEFPTAFGNEVATFGCLWKGISREGVV